MNSEEDLLDELDREQTKNPSNHESICNPKAMQDEFFDKHNRTLPIQSFQVLHQCYHPSFATSQKGDFILILEQQYLPSAQTASTKPKMQTVELYERLNFSIQGERSPINESDEEEHKAPLGQSESTEQISSNHRALGQYMRQQLGITKPLQQEQEGIQKSKSAAQNKATANSDQKNKTPAKNAVDTNTISKSKVLTSEIKQRGEKGSVFKITLWKLDSNEPAVILAEQRIDVTFEAIVLKNKLHFSQDGRYVFLILLDQHSANLVSTVVLDSQELSQKKQFNFDVSSCNINGRDIKLDPQMIYLRDEFYSQFDKEKKADSKKTIKTDSSKEEDKKIDQNYILQLQNKQDIWLCSMDSKSIWFSRNVEVSKKIEQVMIAMDDKEEKMIFILKQKDSDGSQKLIATVAPMQKTLPKLMAFNDQSEHRMLQLKDDELFCSNIPVSEHFQEYKLRQVIYTKEYGIFAKVQDKQHVQENIQSVIFYLPRTSLFSGKDTNQLSFKVQDFHLMQNSNLHKDLSFISLFESNYYVFLAKDLIKNDSDIYSHKNTYQIREQFTVTNPCALDFKNNLLLGFSMILNMSEEVFERPFITYINRGSIDGGQLQVIEKYEINNINPYIIIVEDKSVLNIYSMIDQGRCYRFQLEDQFLQFVDISKGYIQLNDEKYYRHQVLMFLTLNEKGQLIINTLMLPSYSEVQNQDYSFKLNILPFKTEWVKYVNQQIIKAAFIQFPSSRNETIMSLLVQLKQKLLVINLVTGQIKSFQTNTTIPFLQFHPDSAADNSTAISSSSSSHSFYVHSFENGQQSINQLELFASEQPRMLSILELTAVKVVKMQQICSNDLILFDKGLQIKKYRLQQKTLKMKLVDEGRIQEEARKLIGYVGFGISYIEITDRAVYINHQFFQILKKSAKDNYSDFESNRDKKVDNHLSPQTLCLGPYLSVDKQNLIYLYKSNMNWQHSINSNEAHEKAIKLIQALLNMRRKHQMKAEEPYYQIIQVPLLMQNSLSLLHDDDYQEDNVEFSTFTPQDDVLLKMKQGFVAFDIHGNQLKIKIDTETKQILSSYNITQVQLVKLEQIQSTVIDLNDSKPERITAFLLESNQSNDQMVILANKTSHDTYSFSILDNPLMKQLEINKEILFRRSKLGVDGLIYSLMVTRVKGNDDEYKDNLSFTKNGDLYCNLHFRDQLQNLFKKGSVHQDNKISDQADNNVQNPPFGTKQQQQSHLEIFLKSVNEEKKTNNDLVYDFVLLEISADKKCQYIVIKKDLELYFTNILANAQNLQKINVDLDKGIIPQIMPTAFPNIVQFLYTQAKPLQHYIFTWDLAKNIEYQMQTFKATQQIQYMHITMGVTNRENYFIPSSERNIYDLRFQFPLNFFDGEEAHKGAKKTPFYEKLYKKEFYRYEQFLTITQKQFFGEYKFCTDNKAMIGMSKSRVSTIQFPHSYIALQYAQYLIDVSKESEQRIDDKHQISQILEYLKINLQHESNILHYFALNEQFIKKFANEIRSLNSDDALLFIYYLLLPNNTNTLHGRRPLSIAVKQYSPKCIEHMLELLSSDPKQDYLRYIEPYMSKLLSMRSPIFNKFLDTNCQRLQFRVQGHIQRDTVYLPRQTQYINQTNFMKTFQIQVRQNSGSFGSVFCCCFKRRAGVIKKTQTAGERDDDDDHKEYQFVDEDLRNDEALSDAYNDSDDDGILGKVQGKKIKQSAINFYSYEFEQILKGKKGDRLVRYLSDQPINSPLFGSQTLQAYLDSQWQQFKWNYYKIVILYMISFLIMFPYYELFKNALLDNTLPFTQILGNHWVFFFVILPIQFGVSIYLTIFETRKLIISRDPWQWPIIFYNMWQIIMPFIDLLEYLQISKDKETKAIFRSLQYGVNANFIILGLIVLLYKLKYIHIAQFYISRFSQVFKEVYQFGVIILIVEVTFAYAYKIIYSIDPEHEKYGIAVVFKAFEFFFEDTFKSLWDLYKYNQAITITTDTLIMYLLLVLLTAIVVTTNVMLIYFLIATIIESYNKVSQNLKNQKHFSRAKILFENSLLFDRTKVFAKTRYIIKAQAERINADGGKSDLDGITAALAQSVRASVEQESAKNEATLKYLKSRILKISSGYENSQLASEQQQLELKQQNEVIIRFLGDLTGRSTQTAQGSNKASVAPTQQKKKADVKFNANKEVAFTD